MEPPETLLKPKPVAVVGAGVSLSVATRHQDRQIPADPKVPDLVGEMANAIASVAAFIIANPACQGIDINPCIVDTATKSWACADAWIV